MIDSIFVALSGMLGHERALNVISNNVANMNTVGFRGSTASFADVFTGASPNGNGLNSGQQSTGGGVNASRTIMSTKAGQPQQTGQDLDAFLQGEGFFVLRTSGGETRYTRNGNFHLVDDELVGSDLESKVMSRDANGQLIPITIKDLLVNPAKKTSSIVLGGTLSSDDNEHTIDSVVVIDGNGGKHTVQIKFEKDPAPATGTVSWTMTVSEAGQDIGTATVEFLGSKLLNPDSLVQMKLTFGDQSSDVAFNFEAVDSLPNATDSTVVVRSQDGFVAGTISSNTFDENGVLKITYSNGQKADGPKLVLASIADQGGLTQLDNSMFAYNGARPVELRDAGDDLHVLPQSLEQSNVDLTEEFSQLILMQRGYQASSQVISTANDMLQELFDMRGRR